MAAFAAILTAVYMTRMMFMTFWANARYHDEIPGEEHAAHDDDHHALPADFKPHESSWVMTMPLIVLAVLAAVGGLVGIPHSISSLPVVSSIVGEDANRFEHVLEPVIAKVGDDAHVAETAHGTEATHAESTAAAEHSADAISTEGWLAVVSTILAIIGIAIGWFAFIKTPLRKMPKILEEKWRLDEIYNGLIVDPITRFSTNGLWKGVDAGFIDGSVNGIGALVSEVARSLKGLQIGYIRSYAAMVVLGAVVVIGYFIYYGLKLIGS